MKGWNFILSKVFVSRKKLLISELSKIYSIVLVEFIFTENKKINQVLSLINIKI